MEPREENLEKNRILYSKNKKKNKIIILKLNKINYFLNINI
jgi:hypothetical protein